MTQRKIAYLIGAVLVCGTPRDALAQAECACLLPTAAAGAAVGTVSAVTGQVLMSMPVGYGAAQAGATIVSGSRIVVGLNASAVLQFGTACSVMAPAGAVVAIGLRQSGTCVALDTTAAASVPEPAGTAGAAGAGGTSAAALSVTPFTAGLLGLALSAGLVAVDVGRDSPLSQ